MGDIYTAGQNGDEVSCASRWPTWARINLSHLSRKW